MNRIATVAVAVLAVAALAAPTVAAAPDDDWSRTWLVHGAPLTDRVALVLDVSWSMRGEPLERARAEVATVLSLFRDDGRARVYAFNGGVSRLACDEPDGWHRLPSLDVERAVERWSSTFPGSGCTALGAGVARALEDSDDEDLSVVVVTDGEASEACADVVRRAQEERAAGPAVVHVILVRPASSHADAAASTLARVLADGGGGVVVVRRRPGAAPW